VDDAVTRELTRLRNSIDNMDASLIHLLAERFKITDQVDALITKYELPTTDPRRAEQQIERLRMLAADARLDPRFAEAFLNFVMDLFRTEAHLRA
jgi:chorismate mutase